jgi:Cd2+/Zn2+-exporting ATPase
MARENISCAVPSAAGTVVHVAVDGRYAGYLVVADRIRQSAKEMVARLKACGVKRIVMLTGDGEATAAAVAAELGITEYHAGLLPGDKVTHMERLLADNTAGRLAFAGDGINDAPVLSRADIGIAMGALGSDAAIEAADVVLMNDDLLKIPESVGVARKTLGIVRQNVAFALGVKGLVLLLSAFGRVGMGAAVFADVGVALLTILNAARALRAK